MYQPTTSQPNIKLFLKSGTQDTGTNSSPVHVLRNVVKVPHNHYVIMGLEKFYFKQPYFAPSNWCVADISIDNNGTSYSSSMTAADFMYIDLDEGITDSDFQCGRGISVADTPITEDTFQIMDLLEGIRKTINSQLTTLDETAGWVLDYSNGEWLQTWTAMTTAEKEKATDVYINNGYRGLCFELQREDDQTGTAEVSLSGHFITKVLKTSSITFNFEDGAATSTDVPELSPAFQGIQYVKILCPHVSSSRESALGQMGILTSNLLAIASAVGLPGQWEYYETPSERLVSDEVDISEIRLRFEDQDGEELEQLEEYSMILGIEFVEREEGLQPPSLKRGHQML
mmetsp:Transcript_11221/g.14611  ORF Transcript_11221/g.14611 Transcript_11221/m.14611 type:complete len:343 (-) Transcript_11221:2127-3155(-)